MENMDHDASVLRPTLQFSPPLLDQSDWHYHKETGGLLCELQACEEGRNLHSLSQPHLVCQNAAKFLVKEVPHPRHTLPLVGVESIVHHAGELEFLASDTQGTNVSLERPLARGLNRQVAPLDCGSLFNQLGFGVHWHSYRSCSSFFLLSSAWFRSTTTLLGRSADHFHVSFLTIYLLFAGLCIVIDISSNVRLTSQRVLRHIAPAHERHEVLRAKRMDCRLLECLLAAVAASQTPQIN
mmetsp:Transcript_14407/g.39340  ORF Transcript_14407/g.39340 Transcript_14407/m.39340 type:complete len:239 (-) Transcript_14407:324-1040(-)